MADRSDFPLYTVRPGPRGFFLKGPLLPEGMKYGTARECVQYARHVLKHGHGAKVEVYGPDYKLFKTILIHGIGGNPKEGFLYH